MLCLRANLTVRGITLSTQNCAQAGSCPQGGLGHINKHNSESSTLRTNTLGPPVTVTVTQISSRSRTQFFRTFCAFGAADVGELDAVVDAVGRGVGPDDGPDIADAGFEHSARHDALGRVQQGNPDVGGDDEQRDDEQRDSWVGHPKQFAAARTGDRSLRARERERARARDSRGVCAVARAALALAPALSLSLSLSLPLSRSRSIQ